jgi:hypothetical protein
MQFRKRSAQRLRRCACLGPIGPSGPWGDRWLAVVSTVLVTAYVAQVVVPAAETSLALIAGIAPSCGPKTVSPVPNAAAIVRRIWLPELDAGYDPQGLAVDNDPIYVSAYRSDSLSVSRGPCRVIRIDVETGGSAGYVDVPNLCGHAGGIAVGGDRTLYVADTHTLFATPVAQFVRSGRAIPAILAWSRDYWRARCVDAGWDLAWHLRRWSRPAPPLHGVNPGPAVRRRDAGGLPGRNGADCP